MSPSAESEKDSIFEVFKNLFFPAQFKAFKQLFFGSLAFWHQLNESTTPDSAFGGGPFPDEVYFFHPIKFIEHLRKLEPGLRFPLSARPSESYEVKPRKFGSGRSKVKGIYTRFHAGCDLYASIGAEVYAVADGTIKRYANFYGRTYSLEIEHKDFILRYGEVQPPETNHGYTSQIPKKEDRKGLPDGLKVGSQVKRGQHIAYVGSLRLYSKKRKKWYHFANSMVHIEMYHDISRSVVSDPLTPIDYNKNKKYKNVKVLDYKRRSDLLDPTNYLDKMTLH